MARNNRKVKFWVIADTHFGHDKLQTLCGRPVGFERKILKNLKLSVGYNDVLIHLGDFCWGNEDKWHDEFMQVCPSKKWLIRGNHDGKSPVWYMSHGWDFVSDELMLKYFGKKILFTHRPSERTKGFDINIHGHLHNTGHHPTYGDANKQLLFVLEGLYAPVPIETLLKV